MKLSDYSIALWIVDNQLKTEDGKDYDLRDHLFWFDILEDWSPKQVWYKAAQVGGTLAATLKMLYAIKRYRINAIYTMPSASDVQTLVKSKVNRMVANNPALQGWITGDSMGEKIVGDNMAYFRGTFTEQQAISIPSDLNIHDEVDRCFEPGVQVLTRNGWINIEQITRDDKIATFNPNTHRIVWHYPKETIEIDYSGEAYRLLSGRIDMTISPNHKLWARKKKRVPFGQSGKDKFALHKIKDIYNTPFLLHGRTNFRNVTKKETVNIPQQYLLRRKQGSSLNPREKTVYKAKTVDALAFYRFMGWYLSEGSVHLVKKKGLQRCSGDVIITQKNEHHDEIRETITKLGYAFREQINDKDVTSFVIHDMQLALFLRRLGKSDKKYLPQRYLYGKTAWLEAFLDAYIKGDGDDRNCITTKSERMADQLQAICLFLNKNASITYLQKEDIYRVYVRKRNYQRFNRYRGSNGKAHVKRVKYDGKMYCLEVENNTMLVRDKNKGIAFWSGNSSQKIVEMYASRLDNSEYAWQWWFSNPSMLGNGVATKWAKSDQKEWFIKCKGCEKEQYLKWPESICMERRVYQCRKCSKELTDEERRVGRWVQKYKDKEWSGYHISQMMNLRKKASDIIDAFENKAPDYFYNFVLGLPYVGAGNRLEKDVFMKNVQDTQAPLEHLVIGVDSGNLRHWVIGNEHGLMGYGVADNIDDIGRLLIKYPKAIMVIDNAPDITGPQLLQERFPNRVFRATFSQDRKSMELIRWGTKKESGSVLIDRNRTIQYIVDEFGMQRIPVQGKPQDWEKYYSHWDVMFRTQDIDGRGNPRIIWESASDMNHWAFATVYWRAGMTRGTGSVSAIGNSLKLGAKKSPATIDQGIGNIRVPKKSHDWRIV